MLQRGAYRFQDDGFRICIFENGLWVFSPRHAQSFAVRSSQSVGDTGAHSYRVPALTMRLAGTTAALLAAAAALPTSESFTNNGMKSRAALRRRDAVALTDHSAAAGIRPLSAGNSGLYMAALPSSEESAKALSDYMAKSHEDKLRAVKAAEDKKNAEIQVSLKLARQFLWVRIRHMMCS